MPRTKQYQTPADRQKAYRDRRRAAAARALDDLHRRTAAQFQHFLDLVHTGLTSPGGHQAVADAAPVLYTHWLRAVHADDIRTQNDCPWWKIRPYLSPS